MLVSATAPKAAMEDLSRRSFLKAASLAAVPAVLPAAAHAAAAPAAKPAPYLFFSPDEAAWIEAAVARLIPADPTGPSAVEAGVPRYLDRQLAGAWGAGERLFRSGPWQEGAPTQGYQLPFTPAELFRNALRVLVKEQAGGAPFAKSPASAQDDYLKKLESDKRDLGGVPSDVFFKSLLEVTIEGYFSDPVYGGNQDMRAWEMIGFPGAYADYYELVDQHNLAYRRKPMSLGENGRGQIRLHPVSASQGHSHPSKPVEKK
jgi:gluconate 2-dehydrogenase gamma chain